MPVGGLLCVSVCHRRTNNGRWAMGVESSVEYYKDAREIAGAIISPLVGIIAVI